MLGQNLGLTYSGQRKITVMQKKKKRVNLLTKQNRIDLWELHTFFISIGFFSTQPQCCFNFFMNRASNVA